MTARTSSEVRLSRVCRSSVVLRASASLTRKLDSAVSMRAGAGADLTGLGAASGAGVFGGDGDLVDMATE